MMRRAIVSVCCTLLMLGQMACSNPHKGAAKISPESSAALAVDGFYGIIESRPNGKAGTWVAGGRSIKVTKDTELDEEHGSLKVGACAEVEVKHGVVE